MRQPQATLKRRHGVRWSIVAVAAVVVTSLNSCTGSSSPSPAPTAIRQASVSVSKCQQPPQGVVRWVSTHGDPNSWAVATVRVQISEPGASFDLVGIYTGTARIALLTRHDRGSTSDQLVSLNAYAHQLTGRRLDQTYTAVVSPGVVQDLRNCFAS